MGGQVASVGLRAIGAPQSLRREIWLKVQIQADGGQVVIGGLANGTKISTALARNGGKG